MSLDYKPVSLEEYNQSLRDTVNAYYTHAMNDPGMSKEEALQTTGEMSEKYLGAVEEFQESQNAAIENNAETVQETVDAGNVETASESASVDNDGLDGGEGCDGGMDP